MIKELLSQKGIDIKAKDENGNTPFDLTNKNEIKNLVNW